MKVNDENSRIRIQEPDPNPDPDSLVRHGSTDLDPDPHQNVMDPEHWATVGIQGRVAVGAEGIAAVGTQ